MPKQESFLLYLSHEDKQIFEAEAKAERRSISNFIVNAAHEYIKGKRQMIDVPPEKKRRK